jgi:integrase
LGGKETTKSEGTSVRYSSVIDHFLDHLAERRTRSITSITPKDIQSFLTKRMKEGCSAATGILTVKILRNAFNLARRHGLIQSNPTEAVELPESDGVERGTFTPAEVKMLIDVADDDWKTLIALAYFTGARLGDCVNLRWSDVDLAHGTLTFTQQKTKGKPLVIPLHPDLAAILEKLAGTDKPDKHIMPHMAGLTSGGRHGLSEGFKRVMLKAGLDMGRVQGGGRRKLCRRTFHALRHSFNSALANAGVPQETRMLLTGHKTAAINRGYTHAEVAMLKAAVDKMPGLPSL